LSKVKAFQEKRFNTVLMQAVGIALFEEYQSDGVTIHSKALPLKRLSLKRRS
jgi:hypothetical protein